ncbi:MAG TPA: hypothetical protein VGM73_00145 [Candidatus Didemnitutus sp.]|jgi:hypothetical protein
MSIFPNRFRRPRGEILFVVIVVMLGLLALISWFGDPRHQNDGGSRLAWPEKKGGRP